MKRKISDLAKRVIVFFTFISLLVVVDLGARRKISTKKTYYHNSPCKQKRGLVPKRSDAQPDSEKLPESEQVTISEIAEKIMTSEKVESDCLAEVTEIGPVAEPISNPEKKPVDVDSILFELPKPESEIQVVAQQPIQTVQYQQMLQNYQMQQMPAAMPMYQQRQMHSMMQVPMYQQNQNQMAATAMQLQASAMAMQAQASALMMQAQQQPIYAQVPVVQPISRELTKQEKTDQCMHCLRQVVNVGDSAVQRLLLILELEFEILEYLLAGNVGKHVERAVQDRNSSIKTCIPQVVAAYDTILDLSTTYGSDDTGARLYHYCVRKSKGLKQNSPSNGKKKFLMRVMYELEKYYSMLEKMQRTLSP